MDEIDAGFGTESGTMAEVGCGFGTTVRFKGPCFGA